MGGSGPPRLAARVLRLLLPTEDAWVVSDDVAERYERDILPDRGRFRAHLWYWGEVIRSVGPALRLRRSRRLSAMAGGRVVRGPRGEGRRLTVEGWWLDARQAARGLVRNRAWSAAAVAVLALGIGGTAAMYGAFRAVLLKPLPFGEESRIVVFSSAGDWSGPEFVAASEWAGPFEALAAGTTVDWTFRGGAGGSGIVSGVQATGRLFDVLGARAVLGRVLRPGDDVPGAEPVVVISHGMWAGMLGGDPDVVGRRIVLDGVPRTVVGVMPPGFFFPTPESRFWAAMPMASDLWTYGLLTLVGRTGPGGIGAAEPALAGLADVLRARFDYSDGWDRTETLDLVPIREFLVGDATRPLGLLLAAVALLLLIACANVSALVLGRALERRGEVAVRVAMGAARSRLYLQAVTESFVLAVAAGLAGTGIGFAGLRVLRSFMPFDGAWQSVVVADWTLVPAALVVTLFAASVLGVVAVRSVDRTGLEATLRATGRRGLSSGRSLSILVVGEVALTVVLVAGAAALLRSISNLERRDIGLDPEGVVVVDVAVGAGDFDARGRHVAFTSVLDRIRTLPSVRSAGLTQRLPLRDGGWQGPVRAEGAGDDEGPNALWRHVTPGYFETLSVPLVQGRGIGVDDDAGSPRVAVVSRSLAQSLWPGRDAIGQRMRTGITPAGEWLTVVGLVDDSPLLGLGDAIRPVVYVAWAQVGVTMEGNSIVLRSDLPAAETAAAVRAAIADVDDRVAVVRTQRMTAVIAQSIAQPRRITVFLNVFGGLALLLGAVGVYGILSNWVRARLFEFGVRVALGAAPRRVVRLVVSRAGALVGGGIAIGVPLSLAASRGYASLLYDVGPNDYRTLAAAVVVMLVTGAAAAWLPCRRAASADPVSVLRSDG